MFSAITKKPWWVNLLVGAFLACILFFGLLYSLNWFTHHGTAFIVPSVTGKTLQEGKLKLTNTGFEVVIQDSVFIDSLNPNIILKQVPEGDDVVKLNRTVYLIITKAVAPLIDMPTLTGLSFRNAEMKLKSAGLKLGDTTFKPDFAKNAVLEQLKDGTSILPGSKIKMGSKISLVLGSGVGDVEYNVPSLWGLTYAEAKAYLDLNGFVMGVPIFNTGIKDSANAFIYKQMPERYDENNKIQQIHTGQTIDIWLQFDKPNNDSIAKPLN